MERLVVDASVVIKWLVPEDLSLRAIGLRSRYLFAAPDFLFAECTNTLSRKVRRNELSADEGVFALAALDRLDTQIVQSRPIAAEAFELSIKLGHPVYDCFYLCAAAMLNTVMVTADDHLLRKLGASGRPEWAALAVDLRSL